MKYALSMLIALALLAGGFGCHASLQEEPGPLLGEGVWATRHAPELTGRWTVLAFFLPDCEGCITQVPRLTKLREAYTPHGVSLVGVTPVSKRDAKEFLGEHWVPYPVLADADAEFEIYGVREVPETFLLDPDGAIVARGLVSIQQALLTQFGE